MLTIRAAAQLLQNVVQPEGPLGIARASGLHGTPVPLDGMGSTELDLPPMVRHAQVVAGDGSLRALLADAEGVDSLRAVATDLAVRVARRAPHLFWLVVVRCVHGHDAIILTWDDARGPLRVAALHYEAARVLDSDAETLCALAAACTDGDLSRHARWVDILGREALGRRFYTLLAQIVERMSCEATGSAPPDVRRELALLDVSRLLFLAFLQAKGWLDADRAFLSNRFDEAMQSGGRYHARVLRPLFFGTLNTPRAKRAPVAKGFGRIPFLNGGLFARTPLEKRWRHSTFSDEHFGLLHGQLFARYRFTAREESTSWSEAAVDPEMLGRAFESLMHAGARKDSGAFYTPHRIVASLSDDALGILLDGRDDVLTRLLAIRVLDPACGSGAFLVHTLERIALLRAEHGDGGDIASLRRDTLIRSIFGVDVNPTAVWLCELRLWLSVVIESEVEDPLRVPSLPNLDRNIRVGDALAGEGFGEPMPGEGRALRQLRERYVRATGVRKRSLLRTLEGEERRLAIRALDRDLVLCNAERAGILGAMRARDLWGERREVPAHRARLDELRRRARTLRESRRGLSSGGALPFSFGSHFADAAADGGFHLIVGNPPWVRVHRVPPRQRELLRRRFAVYRDSAWKTGAESARAGTGFGGQVDLAALFVERSVQLTRPDGVIALLLPAKLFRTLAAGGVRALLASRTAIRLIEDISDGRSLFEAAVYPAALIASRDRGDTRMRIVVHQRDASIRWCARDGSQPFDETPGSPWLLVPPDVRKAFDAMRDRGLPLSSSTLGRPLLGVKCGLNDAFLVKSGQFAGGGVRPVLRGESLGTWRGYGGADEFILWTHGNDGTPLAALPPSLHDRLRPWRRQLAARADLRRGDPWWMLFRTEAANSARYRVVWADIARRPHAVVLPPGDPAVPLNSCYVVASDEACDAMAFCALLNSPLAAAWLALIAEPARGGYRRYLGWTMSLLPIPGDWPAARTALAELARRALRGEPPDDDHLQATTLRAYGLRETDVAPLLRWNGI